MRLVSRWTGGKPLVKSYRRPQHAFARRYMAADVVHRAQPEPAPEHQPDRENAACVDLARPRPIADETTPGGCSKHSRGPTPETTRFPVWTENAVT
jgi:hypothetical protein